MADTNLPADPEALLIGFVDYLDGENLLLTHAQSGDGRHPRDLARDYMAEASARRNCSGWDPEALLTMDARIKTLMGDGLTLDAAWRVVRVEQAQQADAAPEDVRDWPIVKASRVTALIGEGKNLGEATTIALDEIRQRREQHVRDMVATGITERGARTTIARNPDAWT